MHPIHIQLWQPIRQGHLARHRQQQRRSGRVGIRARQHLFQRRAQCGRLGVGLRRITQQPLHSPVVQALRRIPLAVTIGIVR